MNIKLDMPLGEYRELTKDEFKELNRLLEDSKKVYQKQNSFKKPTKKK